MRPGHFAPDIRRKRNASATPRRSFNEAGAFCPGYGEGGVEGGVEDQASMRPGHFAPDIRRRPARRGSV